jgi:TetR/AcrR family transcriptional regulator, cholesterol catabolism regulator
VRDKNRREDILIAATEVFGSRGYHAANIVDIAEKAGIGKGTIYEYFNSKNSLFIEAVKFNVEDYRKQIRVKTKEKNSFRGMLFAFIEWHTKSIRKSIHNAGIFLKFPLEISLSDDDKKNLCDYLIEVRKEMTGLVAQILSEGQKEKIIRDIDKEFCADILLEMITRLSLRSVIFDFSEEQLKEEKEKLIELYLTGTGTGENRQESNYVI